MMRTTQLINLSLLLFLMKYSDYKHMTRLPILAILLASFIAVTLAANQEVMHRMNKKMVHREGDNQNID